ncbi:hypothetical protein V7S43_007156 [Phytophthora oleae]|uniref:Uncharacterized protein n=1 Tax=Phytophthora oleae TaxID=2107226 RepID=A0ABD3FMG9_9STRA
MVNKTKSKCQLRLEARSRANCAPTGVATDPQLLAAELQSRIARANEVRAIHTRQLAARARARVQHAQEVARGMRVKRYEETRRSRQSSVSKLDEAARRRHEQLEQLQLQCKQRADLIMEKVELVRADQHDKAARARRTLAGQLDDAARRREERTQQRVRRLNERWQSVENVKDRVARVKFIQRWFRRQVANRKTATALKQVRQDVAKVVNCWNQMKTASFVDCMGLLQQRQVVQAAQRLLKVLNAEETEGKGVKSPGRSKTPPSSPQNGINFRVLMMAGMVSCHPNEIMGQDPSKRLHYAASVILADMASLSQCLAVSDGFQSTRELSKCVSRLGARFAFYTEAFARWKKRDAERLAAELLTSYRKLLLVHRKYEMQAQEAQNGVDGVHELLRQTHGQLIQMHRALEKLLGRDGAKERVEELEQNLKQEDGSGGASVDGDASSSSGADNNSASSDNDATTSSSPPMDTGDESDQKKGDDDDEMRGGDDEDDTPTSAQPSSVNQGLLADRKLVHELILNPQFQIPRDKDVEAAAAAVASEQSVAAMAVRVRKAMTKAFWDQVIEANDIKTVLARTEELRTTFRDALGGGSGAEMSSRLSTLADQVDNALRPDQLGELMQEPIRNAHIIQARCNAVLDAFEQAEAPARAETTRAFRSDWVQRIAAGMMTPVQLIVAFLAFALDKVDELRNDVLNAHLGLLGAYLQRHGVEYEQKQLHARLSESGNLEASFPMTIKWLAMEIEAFLEQLGEAERSQLIRHDGAAFERFLQASIWALVEKHIDGSASRVWPETFELDVARIRSCRDALDRIVIVSSLLALLQEYVARRNLATPTGFFSSVSQQLSSLLRSPGVSGAQLAAQATQDVRQLESSHGEDVEHELQALEQRLLGSFAADNPVFKLFFSRAARAFEVALVSQGSSGESPHPSLAPFAAEISEAISALRRLCQHNEKVYASLYNNIIKRLIPSA